MTERQSRARTRDARTSRNWDNDYLKVRRLTDAEVIGEHLDVLRSDEWDAILLREELEVCDEVRATYSTRLTREECLWLAGKSPARVVTQAIADEQAKRSHQRAEAHRRQRLASEHNRPLWTVPRWTI